MDSHGLLIRVNKQAVIVGRNHAGRRDIGMSIGISGGIESHFLQMIVWEAILCKPIFSGISMKEALEGGSISTRDRTFSSRTFSSRTFSLCMAL